MEGRILVVDDEKLTRETLAVELGDQAFEVLSVANPIQAVQVLEREDVDVILTDLRMPNMDGLEFQRIVRQRWPDTAIIFMTAFGSVASAVEAMRQGAADYLAKPLNTEELVIRIRRLVERRRDVEEIRKLRAQVLRPQGLEDLVYRSGAMAAVVERALAVADTDATVLIEGETGTGKEVLARVIHMHSGCAAGPFVALNCVGLNPNLVESELFGHEAGAFTGAMRQRRGRIENAAGGTLFLDEVDDLPPEIQVRLLRFLQEHAFERVGGNRSIQADVRVLCATKESLGDLVRAGRFREDLYFRINTVVITLPPLRARREDVIMLAEHFAAKFWKARGYSTVPQLLPEALRALLVYEWPGNVRELEHVLEHAVVFARGVPIDLGHLPLALQQPAGRSRVDLHLEGETRVAFEQVVADCERQLLDWALARTGGNQAQAAELLGLPRTTFRSRLDALRQGPAANES